MKIFRVSLCLVILGVLFSTLGIEAFGKPSHSNGCSVSAANSIVHFLADCADDARQQEEQSCNDPCDLGQEGHLCHGSFVTAFQYIRLFSGQDGKIKVAFFASIHEAPVLEGLQRPPRHS